MFADDELMTIIDEVDVLVAEIRELNAGGPHFRILHRFHRPGSDCAAGEEVAGIYLIHLGREFFVRLSLALRLLFDYLARHSRLPQSAAQIEVGIRANRFYTEHAAAIRGEKGFTPRISRTAVKVYIQRIRLALRSAFEDAGLQLDAPAVLVSQNTVMNDVGYRLKGIVKWVHLIGGGGDNIDSSSD